MDLSTSPYVEAPTHLRTTLWWRTKWPSGESPKILAAKVVHRFLCPAQNVGTYGVERELWPRNRALNPSRWTMHSCMRSPKNDNAEGRLLCSANANCFAAPPSQNRLVKKSSIFGKCRTVFPVKDDDVRQENPNLDQFLLNPSFDWWSVGNEMLFSILFFYSNSRWSSYHIQTQRADSPRHIF